MAGFVGWVGVGVMLINIPVQLLFERLYQTYLTVYDVNQNHRLRIIVSF